jgi:formylmethanofuran dehydrogenase subunit E
MISGNYDYHVIGIGNPNHPANQDQEPELIECDKCGELFDESELNIDNYQGKDTGWRWCDSCLSELEAEEKKAALTGAAIL